MPIPSDLQTSPAFKKMLVLAIEHRDLMWRHLTELEQVTGVELECSDLDVFDEPDDVNDPETLQGFISNIANNSSALIEVAACPS